LRSEGNLGHEIIYNGIFCDVPAVARAVETAMASWLFAKDVVEVPEANRLLQTGLHPGESEPSCSQRN
jgi:hypothetical protein